MINFSEYMNITGNEFADKAAKKRGNKTTKNRL